MRLRDIGEARVEIEKAIAGVGESTVAAVDGPLLPTSDSRLATRAAVAVAAVVILALAVPATRHLLERPPPAPEMRLDIATPATMQPLQFALSPDGLHLAFVANSASASMLWLRPLNAATARALPGTEGAEYPFWAPDGRTIGFFASGKLKRIDIAAASSQTIADAPNGRGGAWSRDGVILFAPSNATPLLRVAASGGPTTPVTKLKPGHGGHRLPQFLPDGRHFLFFAQGNAEGQGIYLGSLDDGDSTRLMASDVAGLYAAPGVVVFMQQNALLVRRLDLAHKTLEGEPETIADGVGADRAFNLGGFSVSAAGTLAYRLGDVEPWSQLTWFDRSGRKLGVVGEPDATVLSPDLSADGRRIAVSRTVQNNTDIWLIDVQRGGATRFTFDAAIDNLPVWSPDSERIAFASQRKGVYDLYLKRSSGAGADELLLGSTYPKFPLDWSRDGRFLLYLVADPKTGWNLAAIPVSGDTSTPVVVANSPFEERGGQFSPDGHWVAYQSNETGRFEIYVQPFPQPTSKWQVSTAGGVDPRWSADGKELFFVAPDGKLTASIVRAADAAFDAASPVALFQTRMKTGGVGTFKQQYAVGRDGRFLINTRTDENALAPITLILNWKPGFM
jgi:Tol biopolymer transport system component